MSIKWVIEIFWDTGLVDWKYFIEASEFWWAKTWDEVEIVEKYDNPNIKSYRVVSVISDEIDIVKNQVEGFIRLDKSGNWYLKIIWKKE
jgi:hypothetical protein